MKTPLGVIEDSHNSPIVGLGVVGTTISNQIISVSNGIICLWSLSNLSKPIKKIELKHDDNNYQIKEIGVLCMGMQQYENNNLLIGSDDNSIYQITLHGNENEENNQNLVASFKAHEGPIYSVTPHPGDPFNTYNFSQLFLSSSADWTTRLWSKGQVDNPLIVIDNNEDSIYCSKWCPTNASVIACGDGGGNVDFYNFNKDLEVPVYKMNIGKAVVNNISWSYNGKKIAIGDSGGKVKVFEVSKDIYRGTQEDSMKFDKIISSIKLNK
jgi:dynein intermediate chain